MGAPDQPFSTTRNVIVTLPNAERPAGARVWVLRRAEVGDLRAVVGVVGEGEGVLDELGRVDP